MTDINQKKFQKILIIMMGGIGDMVFLTPALKALRSVLRAASICFLLGPYGAENVLNGSHLLDKMVIVSPQKYRGLRGKIRLLQNIRNESFDLCLGSTGSNPLKIGLLCFLSGIKHRLGENIRGRGFFYNLKVPFDKNIHEVEGNIRLVQKLGIEVKDKSLFIHRSVEDKDFAERFFRDHNLREKLVIGMHPGSGVHQAKFKRWPKERFARLADEIHGRYQAEVIIFGGPEEVKLTDEIKELMKTNALVMTGETTLSQAAALIEKCSLFISNDSGLMHVACAVKTPTIGIYGPTDYKKMGPYSDSAVVLRKELDCSPCYDRGKVKCKQLDCFRRISVEDVMKIVDDFLGRQGKGRIL